MALLPTLGEVAVPAKAPAIDGSAAVRALRLWRLGLGKQNPDPWCRSNHHQNLRRGGLLFFVVENLTLDLGGNTLRGACPGEREIGIGITGRAGS